MPSILTSLATCFVRLLPDLDGEGDGGGGQLPPGALISSPAAPLRAMDAGSALASAGRPLRRRVGSTASVEEDIFSTVGGLELGQDPAGPAAPPSAAAPQASAGSDAATMAAAAAEQLLGGGGGTSGSSSHALGIPSVASLADLALVEVPSRTLLVQNVPPDVADEDIRLLFAAHGDIRTWYTACKQQGLVIVGYFDLRSAMAAVQALHGQTLAGRRLEVAFSAPKKGEANQVNQVRLCMFSPNPRSQICCAVSCPACSFCWLLQVVCTMLLHLHVLAVING